jgi:hypothetical protein
MSDWVVDAIASTSRGGKGFVTDEEIQVFGASLSRKI